MRGLTEPLVSFCVHRPGKVESDTVLQYLIVDYLFLLHKEHQDL